MNYVIITDIFGNNISSNDVHNLPFILLHTKQPHLLITKIGNNKASHAYKLIYSSIMHVLHINKIKTSQFAPVGDMWYIDGLPDTEKILLVNTSHQISRYPSDYTVVDKYNKINIWKPIGPKNYVPIGYVINKHKPSLKSMRIINKKLTIDYINKSKYKNILINMNEFNLVGHTDDSKYTIDRTKLLNKDYMVKIMSKNGIVTHKNNKLKLSQQENDNQNVNYTIQGELKMDNKCISIVSGNDIHDNYVYLDDCTKENNQKWYPYSGQLISQYDGSCLKGSDDTLIVSKNSCDKWKTKNLKIVNHDADQEIDNNNSWKNEYGKNVILIEPDTPWYINKESNNKINEPIIIHNTPELNNAEYRDNADFDSKFIIDRDNPSMGYGYSMAQRRVKSCTTNDNIENFDSNKPNTGYNFNLIVITLLIIVILSVIVRMFINNQNDKQ
jgi:hypothetical protein